MLFGHPSGQNRQKNKKGVRFLIIWHSKYSAILSKTRSYRLLFRLFFPLSMNL